MTAARKFMPAIECTPWCIYNDGHPDELVAEDQDCHGKWHTLGLGGGLVSVLAYRRGLDGQPDVCVNINTEGLDDDLHLTAAQARLLAESLTAVAALVEGTEPS